MNESLQRLVILALGGTACLSIVGIIVVAAAGRTPPEALALIATGATTGLCGILVPNPDKSGGDVRSVPASNTLLVPVQVSPGRTAVDHPPLIQGEP